MSVDADKNSCFRL